MQTACWDGVIVPGRSMMGLSIGTQFDEAIGALEISDFTRPLINHLKPPLGEFSQVITLVVPETDPNDWRNELGRLLFVDDELVMMSVNEHALKSMQYRGRIGCAIGLGESIRELKRMYQIDFDDGDEVYYASKNGHIEGLSFATSPLDLSDDADEVASLISVFDTNWLGDPAPLSRTPR